MLTLDTLLQGLPIISFPSIHFFVSHIGSSSLFEYGQKYWCMFVRLGILSAHAQSHTHPLSHTHTHTITHTHTYSDTYRQRIVKKRKEIFVRDFHKEPLSKAGKRVLCYCNILLYLYWLLTQEAIEKKEVRGEKRETILPNIYESFQTMCVCVCVCVWVGVSVCV